VAPRLAVGFMLFKRQIKNLQLTDRSLITYADYTAFNTTIPASDWPISRDPDARPYQQNRSSLYNLNRPEFGWAGLVDRTAENKSLYRHGASFSAPLVEPPSSAAGPRKEHWCSANLTTTRTAERAICAQAVSLQGGRFCDQRNFDIPFIHEFKLAGNYTLPYGVDIGAVLQSYAGLERVVVWTPAASLFPGGRTQSQTIVLNEPGSLWGERWDQLDVNFKKNIRYGNKVHTFQLDVFNVFNNNSIRTMTDTVARRSARHAILPAGSRAGVSVRR
jgi:hypothetical protein